MPSREQIRAICENDGLEKAKTYLASGQYHGIEKGYIQEWIEEKADKKISDERASKALDIASRSVKIAMFSAVTSLISAIAALVAVIWGINYEW